MFWLHVVDYAGYVSVVSVHELLNRVVMWCLLTEISECCSPTAIIATNTLRLDVSAVTDLVAHKEVCLYVTVFDFIRFIKI